MDNQYLFCSDCGLNSNGNIYTFIKGYLICQHCFRKMKEEGQNNKDD